MSEVNWDLAPEGATAVKVDMYKKIYWVDDKNSPWIGGEWSSCPHHPNWKVVATRPTQTKTVEDAVEGNPKWIGIAYGNIYINHKNNWLMTGAKEVDTDYWEFVCTGEQFEACAAKKSEKWTHVYTDDTGTDIRCVLLAEHGEWAWVKDAGTVDTIRKSWLKPIKPTITKAQAWDKCQDYDGQKSMKAYMYDLHEEYDII